MYNNKRGFTLLEILIALFIFSIVSMIMVGALHTVFNSQSNTAKHADAITQLQIAFLLMSHDLEQTINRPVTNAKGIVEGPFIGTHDSVTFTHAGFANPQGSLLQSTLQRTAYSLQNESLVRSLWPVLDQTQKTLPSYRTLLQSVTDLRFEYLDSKGKFQNNWPAEDQKQDIIPRAIRVTITLKNWGTLTQLFLMPQTPKPQGPAQASQPGQPNAQPPLQGQPPNAAPN